MTPLITPSFNIVKLDGLRDSFIFHSRHLADALIQSIVRLPRLQYTTEQVKDLAQGPSSGTLAGLRFELTTFQSVGQRLNF